MAQSLNKHMLIGNVGGTPKISNYQERKVAQFTLATSEVYKDRDGQKTENTDWHNIVAWSPLAEIVEQFVSKGSRIYVEGKSRSRKYTTEQGETRYITEVLANTIVLLDRKVSEGGDRNTPPPPAPQYQRQPQNQAATPQYQQRQPYQQQGIDFGDGLGINGDAGADDMPAF